MIHNAMSKAILEDAPDGTARDETAGLSKRGEPQEGNMTHLTPAVSLCQLTPWVRPDPVPQLHVGATCPQAGAPQGSHQGLGGNEPCPAVNWEELRAVVFFPVSLEVSVWH